MGEYVSYYLDGWIYIGGWIDANHYYYIAVGFIDLLVVKLLLSMSDLSKNEIAYAMLASISFAMNCLGLIVYVANINSITYDIAMQAILVIKLMLVFDKAVTNARRYLQNIAGCILYSLAGSWLCLSAWRMAEINSKENRT